MQKIVVKEVSPSTAENKPTIITDGTGAKMSGFLPELKDLHPGDVIEAELQVKGKFTNIIEVKLLEKSTRAPAPQSNGKPEMTPELWAEKDRLERWSRECNTCFMGIMELAKQPPSDEKYKPVFEQALAWAEAHFKPLTQAEPSQKATAPTEKKAAPSTPAEGEDWPPLKDLGQLYTRAAGYGISPRDVVESVGVGKGEDIIDFDKAWAAMASSTKFASTIKAAAEAS